MAQAELDNRTPFAVEPLHLADEDGRPVLTLVVKATYSLGKGGVLELAEKQAPLFHEGELWARQAEQSSYRFEPECAFIKSATDVVLIGHALPPEPRAKEFLVSFQVGPVRKGVRVVGDRTWYKSLGTISITSPLPVERIPLCYERAFGGWDRSDPDPERHGFEPRNPVGRGFKLRSGRFEEGVLLPNLEDPSHPLTAYGQTPPPAGFGFLSPNWQPRASFAGTYDDAWTGQRMPLLPRDFDRRFFNAASHGLVAQGYLKGNEPVTVVNASPRGRLSFQLPGIPPPTYRVGLKGRRTVEGETRLDTVIVDSDGGQVYLLWRVMLPLRSGPHDLVGMEVRSKGFESPRPIAWWVNG
jgi:hypothetical protein